MRSVVTCTLLVFCLLANAAAFAATAIFRSNDDPATQIVVEIRSHELRIGTNPDKWGYIIGKNNRVYAVSSLGGRDMVMDLLQVAQLARHGNGTFGVSLPNIDKYTRHIKDFVQLKDTKRRETVAGMEGSIHSLVYADDTGKKHEIELVLTQQSALAAMTYRLLDIIDSVHATMMNQPSNGISRLKESLRTRKLGLLRFGNELLLEQLETSQVPAERFALPQGANQLQDALKGLQGFIP